MTHSPVRRTSRPALALVALIACAASLFGAGCRRAPTPGTACGVAGETRCTKADRAVVCHAGAWVEIPCKGRGGCVDRAGTDECDDTRAAEGDPCPPNPPIDYACTADSHAALACKDGRFALWRHCRGNDGCSIAAAHHLNCDTTLGEPGDACEASGTYSCSTDMKQMLVCDGTTLAVASSCGGANGCRFDRNDHKVDCDDSFAREGDRCDRPHRIACGPDGATELVCENGDGGAPVYTKKRECRRSACHVENADLYCD